jgi:hypothetical protein
MRRLFLLPVLALALIAPPLRADDAKKGSLEPKALDILKQTAAVYKDAKTIHVDATVVTDLEGDSGKKHSSVEAAYDMERPNHFSLKTKADGKADAGPDFVSDGKKMFTLAKSRKEYIEEDAASDFGELARKLPELRLPNTGMLFWNVLAESPYDQLMEGVTSASYAGMDKVNGTEAHHLKFEQEGLKWELLVAATGKPVILKFLSRQEGDGGKAMCVETYQNWKIDGSPAKDTFTFSPGSESKKVKSFKEDE